MASIPQHSTVSMTDAGTDALATIGGRHAMLDGKPQGGCTIGQFPPHKCGSAFYAHWAQKPLYVSPFSQQFGFYISISSMPPL